MVIKITVWLATALLALALVVVAASFWVSRPLFDESLDPASLESIPIASPDLALTFARYRVADQLRILLVTKYENGQVTGVDVNRRFRTTESDPVALFAWLGYSPLARAARSRSPEHSVPAASLVIPFIATNHNIGIGTNYVEHARESQVEEKPFVFPKIAQPGHFNAAVSRADARRLDYEAELGFITLEELTQGLVPETMGLVLGNDFTDRWSLVLNLSLNSEMGTTGFVEGKSREGYAPIGNLLVIPKDLDTYYRQVELKLYVNGQLRQRDRAGTMVWGPQEMLGEIFQRENWSFHRYNDTVPLLPRVGAIPRGTIIFSGTPAGVIFKPINLWNPWIYLHPGDEVIIRSDQLGVLQNRIID